MKTSDCDILIVGGGPVGLTLALLLADASCSYRVWLIEQRGAEEANEDARVLALSHGARQILQPVGAWPSVITPIKSIHTSQQGGFGRTLMEHTAYNLPALGYVLRYQELTGALRAALGLQTQPPQNRYRCKLQSLDANGVTTLLETDGSNRSTRTIHLAPQLIVYADGTPKNPDGKTDACSAIKSDSLARQYGQHAVIAEVRSAKAHENRAWERFTPDGPLALLPLDDSWSVVMTLPEHKAQQVLQMDDKAFLAALQARFGPRHHFIATGPRLAFPLELRLRKHLARGRETWIGNSAQTLHPVSGQGFNLGLRDARQLASLLLENRLALSDIPQHYAKTRALDRWGGALFTDGVVRLFSNSFGPLRVARGLGLLAMDLFPPARHIVARRMIWGARAWL